MFDETREKEAVGRAAPRRTGAMREFAVSQSSSMAMLISAWNTRLHFISGWEMLTLLINHHHHITIVIIQHQNYPHFADFSTETQTHFTDNYTLL